MKIINSTGQDSHDEDPCTLLRIDGEARWVMKRCVNVKAYLCRLKSVCLCEVSDLTHTVWIRLKIDKICMLLLPHLALFLKRMQKRLDWLEIIPAATTREARVSCKCLQGIGGGHELKTQGCRAVPCMPFHPLLYCCIVVLLCHHRALGVTYQPVLNLDIDLRRMSAVL